MNYFDIQVTVKPTIDFTYFQSFELLANLIFKAMTFDEQLKELHDNNSFKYYNFCSLYPVEKDKIYKKNNSYTFNIRSLNMDFAVKINSYIQFTASPAIKVVASQIKKYDYYHINSLKTLTPCVSTINNKSWTMEDGLPLLMEKIHSNAVKKCKQIYNDFQEPNENFIEMIELLNKTPIKIKYKNNSFLGNKILIQVKPDEVSQKLAFVLMGSGLLEKNSIGFGYVIAK